MRREDGFTLLEVLVALAVFSLGALALLNVVGEGVRAQTAVRDRSLARIVAENRLVELMAPTRPPGEGVSEGEAAQMGRTFVWQARITPSGAPRMLRIDVSVRASDGPQVLAELSTLRAAP